MASLDGWILSGEGAELAIEKTFVFPDYAHTMAFVNALAWAAQARDHHPDLLVKYDRCVVRYRSHDVGGLSRADFHSAAELDATLGQLPAPTARV